MLPPTTKVYNVDKLRRWKRATWWFSVIFLLAGVMITLAALYLWLGNKEYKLASALPVSYLVTGCFIVIVSFFGWYSSRRESKTLLIWYIVLLVLSSVTLMAMAINSYVTEIPQIETRLNETWNEFYYSDDFIELYDVALEYKCCGFEDAQDRPVPDDCIDEHEAFADGCADILIHTAENALVFALIVGLCAVFVMGIGLVFAYLTYKEAPSKAQREQLVDEEIQRLNLSWPTTSMGATDSTQR